MENVQEKMDEKKNISKDGHLRGKKQSPIMAPSPIHPQRPKHVSFESLFDGQIGGWLAVLKGRSL